MIAQWREQRKAVEPDTEPVKKMSWKELFALTLNLLSAFMYCMNYYIVEPSSTKYVNALGASDNYSGLLIGMMPIAALCSAVVYSIWTNHCFRVPLLVSGSLLIVGNVLYASALKSNSITVALGGRFLTGLGGPKCIVRRYMADTVPITSRTSVNAAFGMAIAVGSALGPAAAILVDQFEFSFTLPLLGVQSFNGMTG
jgi:sugar phosphate permease